MLRPFVSTLCLYASLVQETDRLKKPRELKVGGGCLYIKDLREVTLKVLEHVIPKGAKAMAKKRLK